MQSNNSKKPSAGKVIGYMILTILMVAIIVGGFSAWQQRDKFEEYLPERWKKAERLQDQAQLPESTTPEKGNGLCFDSDNIAQQHQSASAACEEGHFKSLDIEERGDTSINVKVGEKDLGPDKGSNTDPQYGKASQACALLCPRLTCNYMQAIDSACDSISSQLDEKHCDIVHTCLK